MPLFENCFLLKYLDYYFKQFVWIIRFQIWILEPEMFSDLKRYSSVWKTSEHEAYSLIIFSVDLNNHCRLKWI